MLHFFTTRIGASVWSRVRKSEKRVREGNWMECMHCVWPRVSRSWSQHEEKHCSELERSVIHIRIYSQSLAGSQKVMKQSEASRALSIRQSGTWMLEVVSYEPQDPRAKWWASQRLRQPSCLKLIDALEARSWADPQWSKGPLQGESSASHPMTEGWLTQDHDRWYYGHIDLFLHLKCLPFTFIYFVDPSDS